MSRKQRSRKEYIEIKELFSNFLTWLKTPDSDKTLVNWWKRRRARDKKIKEIEAKRRAEEYKQKVAEQAYLLWKVDGEPEGKDDYYWKLAVDKIEGKNVPTIYRPYYLLEKRILEPSDAWIDKQAFFTILGRLGNLAVVAAVIGFIGSENLRRNNEVFAAWQTITSAYGQSGSGGRIQALEFLNSRPLRFPWIGWTEKDWFWDEGKQECKYKRLWGLRWEREPLVGLSAPNNAYLRDIHLCGANLRQADLQDAYLFGAKLQGANFREANLQNANLLDAELQNTYLLEANLQNVKLLDANLQNANLKEANLQNAHLLSTELQNADLEYADFQNTHLWNANLQNANLKEANLQNATLLGANFQNANLLGANFQNTTMFGKELQNAFPEKTENSLREQIKSACNWEQATYKVDKSENQQYIKELKKDTASDPAEPPDCSRWQ